MSAGSWRSSPDRKLPEELSEEEPTEESEDREEDWDGGIAAADDGIGGVEDAGGETDGPPSMREEGQTVPSAARREEGRSASMDSSALPLGGDEVALRVVGDLFCVGTDGEGVRCLPAFLWLQMACGIWHNVPLAVRAPHLFSAGRVEGLGDVGARCGGEPAVKAGDAVARLSGGESHSLESSSFFDPSDEGDGESGRLCTLPR